MPLMAKSSRHERGRGHPGQHRADITQIKQVVDLPVIGIIKRTTRHAHVHHRHHERGG